MFLKFPVVDLHPIMRKQIIEKSAELFLILGFKSVTMDDIANEMGISKKTIYVHFENKTKLIEATASEMFELISCGIQSICQLQKDPIEEIFEIKKLVMAYLKDEKSSHQYQLQKYYPKVFNSLKSKQYSMMEACVSDNLRRGIALGIYRDTIEIELISKIYFTCMMALKDKELFPLNNFSMQTLMNHYLEYHLRGICTPKGIETLTKIIHNQS